MKFEKSDSWLLVTLSICRGAVDRVGLKSAGDYINHAVFSDEEIDGGILRLSGQGWAKCLDGDQFEIMPEGAALVETYKKGKNGLVGTMMRLGDDLANR